MNKSVIRFLMGKVLKTEAVLMLLPCLVALIYREKEGVYYLFTLALCWISGFLLCLKSPKSSVFYLKEGCITTALSWIFLSLFGALPFFLSREIPSFLDALFETVSGFTTTGASILNDVECLSRCSLFWRSFTHWIGGMGVLVFIMAIIPLSGGSSINLMKAESPGPSVGKFAPKLKSTARILYGIYFALTVLQIILLLIGNMPVFDSVCTAFGTAGTGGFGIKNSSIAGYSPYLQWVITVFMILFGVNFNAYYLIVYKKFRKAFSMEEVRWYFIIIISSIGIIFFNILGTYTHIYDALRDSAFQVASIITTTGFSTVDFNLWNSTAKTVLVLLMFIGACAGSTGGGIKVSRFVVVIKTIKRELNSYIHPNSVKKIQVESKAIDKETIKAINVYFITFIVLFTLSVFFVSFEGKDLTTNFTAVAATINNIGPGLELAGPASNFSVFSPLSKIVFIIDMLAGRLELFPLLILFHPANIKEFFTRRK